MFPCVSRDYEELHVNGVAEVSENCKVMLGSSCA